MTTTTIAMFPGRVSTLRMTTCAICFRTIAQLDGMWLPLCAPTDPAHQPAPADVIEDMEAAW